MAEHRRWLRIGAALVVVLALLLLSDAGSAQSRVARAHPVTTGTRFGIPPQQPNPYTEPYDGKGIASAQAPKIKTTISLPESTFLTYLQLCVEVADQGTFDPANCPEFHPPKTSFDASDSLPIWLLASGPTWVASPAGSRLRYGSFAPVRVRTLAFGSIPVSAVVHVTQPVGRDGYVQPLQIDYLTNSNTNPTDGGQVYGDSRWPGISIPAGTTSYLVEKFLVSGPVDVRLSDVEVDGRPVDVGGSCRTVRPGRLELGSPAGYYQFDTPAASLRGRPGGAQVLNIDGAGTAQGQLSVPALSGCRDGRGSLDPLLTDLVSGDDNPIEVAFTEPFNACSRDDRPRPCPAYPTPVAAAPQRVSIASPELTSTVSGPAASASRWDALAPSAQASLARIIAHLRPARQALVVAALPPQAEIAVREARESRR